MRNQLFVLPLALAICAGCAAESEPPAASLSSEPEAAAPAPAGPPAMIVAERGGFIPEGIEYDTTNGRFLTGSLSEGSILQIHDDGRVTTVVSDPDLVSSIGIEVDEPRDRLLVANSDRAVFDGSGQGQAKLGVYDLATGDRLAMVDLAAVAGAADGAAYFANDVAVADDDTAYVTDTQSSVIYRVGTDYEAALLYRFEAGTGPNGIVHHADGFLLVAGGAMLWKVTLDEPVTATEVTLPEEIPGQDGAVWTADGRLAIVSNSGGRVVALTSNDDWATAQLAGVAPYETQATTAAVIGNDVYVVHPHFADADPPSVERVSFDGGTR